MEDRAVSPLEEKPSHGDGDSSDCPLLSVRARQKARPVRSLASFGPRNVLLIRSTSRVGGTARVVVPQMGKPLKGLGDRAGGIRLCSQKMVPPAVWRRFLGRCGRCSGSSSGAQGLMVMSCA